MIFINYKGRLGNEIFQYCLARIINLKLGYSIKSNRLSNWPEMLPDVDGLSFESPVEYLLGHEIDLDSTLNNFQSRKIILDGNFQRVEYYKDYKEEIRNWIKIPRFDHIEYPKETDLVVHIRGGDLFTGPFNENHAPLPIKYYKEIIETEKWDKLWVVTEELSNPLMNRLIELYNPKIICGDLLQDFSILHYSYNVVLSVSTLGWWGSWLNNIQRVHFPLHGLFNPKERVDINLVVEDNRYTYYKVEKPEKWTGSPEQIKDLMKE